MSWALIAALALQAGPPAPCLDADMAVARALDGAAELALADARVVEAEAARSEVKSLWRPQLSAYADSSIGETGLTGSRLTNQAGLQVSQRLFDWGDATERARRGDALIAEAAARREEDAVTLTERVASLVADHITARQRVALYAASLEELSRKAAAIEPLLEEGLATRQDVAALRADIFAKQAQLEQAEQQAQASLQRLQLRYGLEARPCPVIALDDGLEEALSGELRYPEVEGARARVAAARSDFRLAGKARLPVIAVTGRASYASTSFDDRWAFREQAGISLSTPLYAGSALAARRRQAAARVAQGEAELRLTEMEAAADAGIMRSRVASLQRQVELLEASVDELRLQLVTDEERVAMGAATLEQLLETRRRLDAKAAELIEAKGELFVRREVMSART